jgi:ArsR family transcriptional regulator
MNETDACLPRDDAGPDPRPVEGPEADGELAALSKALAHPARVRIVRLLGRGSTCICGQIVDELELAQSTVSQHLKIMKEAGLIQGEVDGPRVCYCLSPAVMRRFRALVGAL